MKITIDTKSDHPDHIKQAIALLQAILGQPRFSQTQNNIFEQPVSGESAAPPASSTSLFSMFDSAPAQPAAQEAAEPEDEPQIELY